MDGKGRTDLEEMAQFAQQLADLSGVIAEQLAPKLRAFQEALVHFRERFLEPVWTAYVNAGMPYDKSWEGVARWLEETQSGDEVLSTNLLPAPVEGDVVEAEWEASNV